MRTCDLCRAEYQYCLAKADVAPRRHAVIDYASMSMPSDIEPWPVDEVTPVRLAAYPNNPPEPRWVRGPCDDGTDPDVVD